MGILPAQSVMKTNTDSVVAYQMQRTLAKMALAASRLYRSESVKRNQRETPILCLAKMVNVAFLYPPGHFPGFLIFLSSLFLRN